MLEKNGMLTLVLRGVLSNFMIRASHAPCGMHIFSHFFAILSNTKNTCIFSCMSQLKLMIHHVLHNKIMCNNSSCSSDSNTFQMYQDFDILFGDPIPRRDRWDHSRIDWDTHMEQLCHEQHFNREYRMSLQALNKLISLLSPLLKRNDAYSRASGPISPVIIVGIGIQYLAGGELADI